MIMRRAVFAAVVAGAFAVATPAQAQVPRHLHCLTNASGNDVRAIAGGLTANAPETAFQTFHSRVHLGVFVNGLNPHTLMGSFTGACPP